MTPSEKMNKIKRLGIPRADRNRAHNVGQSNSKEPIGLSRRINWAYAVSFSFDNSIISLRV